MNKIKIGKTLAMIGFVIWIIENFWFGWNRFPMSEAERICDMISYAFMYIGFLVYLSPVFSLYENAVKRDSKNNP